MPLVKPFCAYLGIIYIESMVSDLSKVTKERQLPSVVILGGSGFVGTHLNGLLIRQNLPILIGDIQSNNNYREFFVECDVRDPESLTSVVQGAEVIVNLAAEHRDDVRPLSRYRETNVDGAVNVCDAARAAGTKKIIFTSSVAVYGFHPDPLDESGPFTPFNEYGKTKLAAEAVYRAWAAENPSHSDHCAAYRDLWRRQSRKRLQSSAPNCEWPFPYGGIRTEREVYGLRRQCGRVPGALLVNGTG